MSYPTTWTPKPEEADYYSIPSPSSLQSPLATLFASAAPKDPTFGRAALPRSPAEQKLRNEYAYRDGTVELDAGRVTVSYQVWDPKESVKSRNADLLFIHGINDYGGKFAEHARQFLDQGYRVIVPDLPSHGRSSGIHVHLADLDILADACYAVLTSVLTYDSSKAVPDQKRKIFVAGQSLGGFTAALTCLKYGDKRASDLDPEGTFVPEISGGLFLCPMLAISPETRPAYPVELLARGLASFAGSYPLAAANKGKNSEDPTVEMQFEMDPQTYHGKLRIATGLAILKGLTELDQLMSHLKVPFSLHHGTGDRVTSYQGSEKLYRESSSTDKKLHLYDDYQHILLRKGRDEADDHRRQVLDNMKLFATASLLAVWTAHAVVDAAPPLVWKRQNPVASSVLSSGAVSSLPSSAVVVSGVSSASSPLASSPVSTPMMNTTTNSTKQCQNITMTVNLTNIAILNITAPTPASQQALTAFVSGFGAVGSTFLQQYANQTIMVNQSYDIAGTLCRPSMNNGSSTVIQFLQHGIGFDRSYWDLPTSNATNNYSYVDVATAAGYSTLAIDRLGVGESSKPNGTLYVQTATQVHIARAIIRQLKGVGMNSTNSTMGMNSTTGMNYTTVVGVGHSYGSVIFDGLAAQYPSSADALVLTGYSHNLTFTNQALSSWVPVFANGSSNAALSGYPPEYWAFGSEQGIQFDFFKYPYYPETLFNYAVQNQGPYTIGEVFTLNSPMAVTTARNFTGPVASVNGDADAIYCGGNCSIAAPRESQYYPASSRFQSILAPNAGHAINAHYSAHEYVSVY